MRHRYRCSLPAVMVVAATALAGTGQPAEGDRPVNLLATKQQMILDRLNRLEDRMFRLREKLSQIEPASARKLEEALRRTGELDIGGRVQALTEALRKTSRLEDAIEEQQELVADYQVILDVLLGRNPDDINRREQLRRMAEIKEDLERLIHRQRLERAEAADVVRGLRLARRLKASVQRLRDLLRRQQQLAERTAEGDGQHDQHSDEQSELAEETKLLAKDVERLAKDAVPAAQGAAEADDTKGQLEHELERASGDLDSGAEDMAEAARRMRQDQTRAARAEQTEALEKLRRALHRLEEAQKRLAEDADPRSAAKQQRDLAEDTGRLSQRMKDAPPAEGSPSPGEPSPTPGEQNVERARQHMDDAADELEGSDAEQAIEEQDQALDELERAQRRLEEALKQMRTEEQEDILRSLEARLAEMAAVQATLNSETAPLSRLGADHFTRAEKLKCAELADRQERLGASADTCVRLLEEDGTTVVFPSVMRQVSTDMRAVAHRLAEVKVGPLTVAAQKEILSTLEELAAALKKLREQMERRPPGGAPGGGQTLDPPLVPTSAELKLLRSAQQTINEQTVTAEAARLEGAEQEADVAALLQRAAQKQGELAEMARRIQERAEKGQGL